ncbi:MAG: hypothetical protein IPJ41_09425 [Phycisphaerales bacterium]|nr:hypothetical protein [Phycisphaerales bacterium]
MRLRITAGAGLILLAGIASAAFAQTTTTPAMPSRLSPPAHEAAYRTLNRAIEYLRAHRDASSGGWGVNPQGVTFPAITALVIDGMLQHPAIDAADPDVAAGLAYLLSKRQPDGGIYDRVLPSYNTAIALSALARAGTKDARAAVPPAQRFLMGLQWSEDSLSAEVSKELGVGKVDRSDPFYGGVGYGSHGRPDLSNLAFMLQALHDSGYEAESPPFQRAVVFLERLQMDDRVNSMPYAAGRRDGGFIYATGPSPEKPAIGDSEAGSYEETLDDGSVISRLRCYGSMTYSGFKSYLYADLPRDDPRVQAALQWIGENYTLDENPGIGQDGYYYYLVAFSRALDAWDHPVIKSAGHEGTDTVEHRWAEDLVTKLASLQQEDGSFAILANRWLEKDPVLVTAYGVLALQAALDNNPTVSASQ